MIPHQRAQSGAFRTKHQKSPVIGWSFGQGFLAALVIGAIFMILEVDQPYDGLVRIPSTSLTIALDQLGKE